MKSNRKPNKIDDLLKNVRNCVLTGRFRETYHAQVRQKERTIFLKEVLHVLCNGKHEKAKDKFDEEYQAWNYAIRGETIDGDDLRVIVSFDEKSSLLIITAFFIGD